MLRGVGQHLVEAMDLRQGGGAVVEERRDPRVEFARQPAPLDRRVGGAQKRRQLQKPVFAGAGSVNRRGGCGVVRDDKALPGAAGGPRQGHPPVGLGAEEQPLRLEADLPPASRTISKSVGSAGPPRAMLSTVCEPCSRHSTGCSLPSLS